MCVRFLQPPLEAKQEDERVSFYTNAAYLKPLRFVSPSRVKTTAVWWKKKVEFLPSMETRRGHKGRRANMEENRANKDCSSHWTKTFHADRQQSTADSVFAIRGQLFSQSRRLERGPVFEEEGCQKVDLILASGTVTSRLVIETNLGIQSP